MEMSEAENEPSGRQHEDQDWSADDDCHTSTRHGRDEWNGNRAPEWGATKCGPRDQGAYDAGEDAEDRCIPSIVPQRCRGSAGYDLSQPSQDHSKRGAGYHAGDRYSHMEPAAGGEVRIEDSHRSLSSRVCLRLACSANAPMEYSRAVAATKDAGSSNAWLCRCNARSRRA